MPSIPLLPFDRDVSPLDPPSAYGRMRAEGPVRRIALPNGRDYWLVTGYHDIRSVLAHPGVSADPAHDDYPRIRADDRPPRPGSFITSDAPEHTRLRRMLTSTFRHRNIERLKPAVAGLTRQLLDGIENGPRPADLVADFAQPLQTRVLCELLGVPYQDHALFQRIAHTISDLEAPGAEVAAARTELSDYLLKLLERKDRDPGEDLFSELAVHRVRTGELTSLEAAGMGTLLLFAGQEPTANTLALSVLALLRDPARAALLTAEPDAVPAAVEELLRHVTVIHFGMRRVATEDITVGDVTIRAGEGIILPLQSANRDERVYDDPDTLDLRRAAQQHVAFGFGVHQCIGQPLARAELRIALPALLGRFPGLRLAVPEDRLVFRDQAVVYGVRELPVTW
ncbi:cytochrome P450 [Streptomyces sp. J2-1]|uniref:cytochrome P450 n=1 Tax=Streptomyces corallincola TaxID=2851888 RepID=UPI001C384660|nr:cytochrome P450 [Streptomyces corallincola]MBV2353830.1 cytochrome P450 [Streptomyces corallincola]